MAACGCQATDEEKFNTLARDEEKVDKPKRLFNYKPAGVKSPDYMALPEIKSESGEEWVASTRKVVDEVSEVLSKSPMFINAMENNVTTEFTVKKGKICDGDITVCMHRPKNLPKERCPAMIFVHGGTAVAGRARDFTPIYTLHSFFYGVVGFNVGYRLAPEHRNKGGSDVYAVLKYVYENAEKLGIDKTRIGMEGQSAGVHHIFNACNLMAHDGETGMCKMILSDVGMFTSVLKFGSEKDWEHEELVMGPTLDIMYQTILGDKYKEHINNKDPMLFPELVEEGKLKVYPPVVFFSAEFCAMHKGNKMIAERLEKVGKLLEFRVIRGLGHVYFMANNKETQAVFQDRIKCVNHYLKN